MLLVVLLLLFKLTGSAQTGWPHQPAVTTENLNSLAMDGYPDRIYAAGDGGTVLFTSDQGISWTPIPTNTQASLKGIAFTSSTTAFADGDSGTILKISNGVTTILNSGTLRDLRGSLPLPMSRTALHSR